MENIQTNKISGKENPQVKFFLEDDIPMGEPLVDELAEMEKVPLAEKIEIPAETPDSYKTPKTSKRQYDTRFMTSCLRGYSGAIGSGLYYKYFNGLNQYGEDHPIKYPVAVNYDNYPLYRNQKQVDMLLRCGLNKTKKYPRPANGHTYRIKIKESVPEQFGSIPPAIDGVQPDQPDQNNKKQIKGTGIKIEKPSKVLFSIPN